MGKLHAGQDIYLTFQNIVNDLAVSITGHKIVLLAKSSNNYVAKLATANCNLGAEYALLTISNTDATGKISGIESAKLESGWVYVEILDINTIPARVVFSENKAFELLPSLTKNILNA